LAIPAALFFLVAAFFVYARYIFSSIGGNVQNSVWELVLSHLDWNGKGEALDIGCGNGVLAIKLAQKYPKAHFLGKRFVLFILEMSPESIPQLLPFFQSAYYLF
jgi:hypothetical protein